jgi:tetratricopeptide (TPR) repeat protein
LIPTDPGFDPVQAAYNLTRKNPAVDWEIEMLAHLKSGNFSEARRCGMKAADINIELATAPEVDAKSATEHLIKAAQLLEHVKEFAKAADTYEEAVKRDPQPGTRLVEGRRVTSPLRHFELATKAGREAKGRAVLNGAAHAAEARYHAATKEERWAPALDDAQFLADIHQRLQDLESARTWWRHAVDAGVHAGAAYRQATDDRGGDRYELSRAAFEQALTCCLQLDDRDRFVDTFRKMADTEAKAARPLAGTKEKWEAFRPMEWLMEAGVHYAVLGDFKRAGEFLDLTKPLVTSFWKDQRGPTFYKMSAHLAILSGNREEAERWRKAYHEEFQRKERFDPEVVKPIQLEFDEEFYRMLGEEGLYRKTLIEICRNLEPGMREVFDGVDKLFEEGLWRQARQPLDELTLESKDQRIWRLLSAFVDWRLKVEAGTAREADGRAFEDHMWHAIHPFQVPRQGLVWGAVLEALGAEEDPIDLYPLPRALAFIHGAAGKKA